MKFTPTKMTIQLEDGRIVELDLNNMENLITSSSAPLTEEEQAILAFRIGMFLGSGQKALNQFE